MAVLKVASNANAALTLPAILAAAYVTHQGGEVDITFEEVDHLGSDKDAVELATDTGDRLIGDAIFAYLQDFDCTGYLRVDQAYRDGQPAVMFNIPTRKEASSNT
ncbi:hypothetical protein BDV33DRAFT_203098 [Aspergillus novoparasiticus]|uniref:Uncharacterized protein n=1 Tax=Aspergillus novoparasiticus TaxID=986946 RepID=A0A5N6EW51_9EURO|nr:hypothetical protein BDV33DRAFT_203098 [Aspergillus novoparasiticus]